MEPTWSLDQALVWCAFRDIDEAERPNQTWVDVKLKSQPPSPFTVPGPQRPGERWTVVDVQGPVFGWAEIEAALVRALRLGRLSPCRSHLTPSDFEDARVTYDADLRARFTVVSHLPSSGDEPGLAEGRSERVRFRIEDVMSAFPVRLSEEREPLVEAIPPLPGRRRRQESVRDAVRALWPGGIPNILSSARDQAINDWLAQHSLLKVDPRTIQRALKTT